MIEFFHIGECDKYITTLIYKKTGDSSTITKEYVKVSERDFDILQDYLIRNNSNNRCDTCYKRYGSFRISIVTKDSTKLYYFIEGRNNSLTFFNEFKKYIIDKKVDNKIIQELDEWIIRRIDHSAPIERYYETESWKKTHPNLK
jgi:hypothetical protein